MHYIRPQITTTAPATIKIRANVSATPSLEELAGENVTAPTNVTSAKVPSNITAPSTNATEQIKKRPSPLP
jgi:hypothetical protein